MLKKQLVRVAARSSKLSRAQVKEVEELYPFLIFKTIFIETRGDLDKKQSLRTMDKTDFFTKEVDELVLNGICDLAIHSAKDLPDPIPEGLKVVAITKGVDSSDSLVIKGELKKGMVIGTSSKRREENVLLLNPNVTFVDIRGTIEERLKMWEQGKIDAVVLAEAALIRLGLTHLSRIKLPGEVAPLQGRLALVASTVTNEFWNANHQESC